MSYKRPVCFCTNCESEFAEEQGICPECGENGDIHPIHYCPYCDTRMDYFYDPWESDVQSCPKCDAVLGGDDYPASDAIEDVKGYLKFYDEYRKEKSDAKNTD